MSRDYSEILSTPLRVLVVDNNKDTAKIYKDLLELWGYKPILATGSGQPLLQDAKKKARESRCQMALVDLRLIDDFDNQDQSGLLLASQIKPTASIIITGYGTIQLAVESIQNQVAASFIIKGGPPEEIQEQLKRVASRTSASERSLQIGPPKTILTLAETLFEEKITTPCRDQLLDVLARLFPAAHSLTLIKMNPVSSTSGFAEVPRPRSVILKIREDGLQPVIVKLARRHKIETEVERYNQYIRKRLGSLSAPDFEEFETLWDIGGIKFSYTGNIEKTFEHLYKNEPVETIQHTLHRFFAHTWADHYQNARKVGNASLLELYRQVWEEDWIKRIETFPPLDPGQVMGPERWLRVEAPDPLAWFRQKILNDPDGPIGRAAETVIAVTHGDLHAGNLLIDDSNNAWVIDFERTGEGHALQDFIELESDLINRMLPGSEHLPFYHRLCFAVTAPAELGLLENDFGLAEPVNAKIIQTISIIRSLARECTGITDIHQYLVGLLFNTLFRATIIKNTSDPSELKSQYRALMLASIICHRLDHWDEPWPPENWLNLK